MAVVATGAATFALRPRGLIRPAHVAATDYFSASELDRADDFNGPQRLLGLGSLVVTGGTLTWLGVRPPRRVRRLLERGAARPILAAAGAGAGLAVVLVVVTLPLAIPAEQRSRDAGLSTQDWGSWTVDLLKSTAISAVLTAGGAAILVALVRRFPRTWFLFGAARFAPAIVSPGRRPDPRSAILGRRRIREGHFSGPLGGPPGSRRPACSALWA